MLHVMTVDLIQVHQSQRVPADLGFQGYVDLSSYNLDDVMGTNIWKSLKKKKPHQTNLRCCYFNKGR